MGGRGSWSYGGGKGSVGPKSSGRSQTSNELGIMIRGGSTSQTLDNFRRVIGDSDTEYSMVIDKDGNIVGNIFRGSRHSTKVDIYAAMADRETRMVHNHPDPNFGGTFSKADLQAHANVGNRGMEATAKEGTYLMRTTSKTDYEAFGKAYDKARPKLEAEWQRKWAKISKTKTFKTQNARDKAERQVFVGVFHRWYKDNASQYGLKYTFAKGRGLGKSSTVNINKTYKDWYDENRDY